MKRYIYSKTKLPKYASYKYVDEVLNTLFGLRYTDYKNKSDWFESDFGLVRYDIGSGRWRNYQIRIYFNNETFDPSDFYNLMQTCKDNDIRITSQFLSGNDNVGKHDPQLNIVVDKWYPYSYELDQEITQFITDMGKKYLSPKFKCFSPASDAVNYIDYNISYNYGSDGIYSNPVRWAEYDETNVRSFIQDVKTSLLDEFPEIADVKLTFMNDLGCHLRVMF